MTVARFAISFDQALAKQVRKAAGKEPTSAWLADAARRKLRAEGLMAVVSEWEEEFGALEETSPKAPKPAARRRRA
jgi:hypothetical protein